MKKLFVIIFALIVSILACSKSTQQLVKSHHDNPTVIDSEETEGMALFQTNCGLCHKLPLPKDYTTADWNRILPTMIKEAEIESKTDIAKIEKYVFRNCK